MFGVLEWLRPNPIFYALFEFERICERYSDHWLNIVHFQVRFVKFVRINQKFLYRSSMKEPPSTLKLTVYTQFYLLFLIDMFSQEKRWTRYVKGTYKQKQWLEKGQSTTKNTCFSNENTKYNFHSLWKEVIALADNIWIRKICHWVEFERLLAPLRILTAIRTRTRDVSYYSAKFE